jgi:hypothetical protein
MDIKSKEIKLVDIDLLIENPKNNNKHPKEQIERLAKIIKAHGFRNPLVVSNRSGFVLCGHGRIEAAKKLGMTQLPVIHQDFDSEAEEYAHMTADNAIAAWATLDTNSISESMITMGADFDFELLGLKEFSIDPCEELDLDSDVSKDLNQKYILEVTFPNDMEMMDIHDDLSSRGYIVRIKDK